MQETLSKPVPAPHPQKNSILKGCLIKGSIFVALTVLVLNPNLKRAYLQIGHILHPDALIQERFPSSLWVNAQVDRFVAADAGKHSEARLVARFVLKKIRYVTDYENWGNLDYWPTPEETWQKGQEDCDGRAVLAASILRSRGFHSARLVVGLDHMWLRVNENEKDPSKPCHFVSLLSPNPDFSLEMHEKSRWGDFARLAKAFLHPTALKETSTHLFADIPAMRKALLIALFLGLCYHPCQNRTGLLAVIALGLAAAGLLGNWEPEQGPVLGAVCGAFLFCLATAVAMVMARASFRVRTATIV